MRSDERAMLLSIRPRFAEMLIAGTKTVELRRIRPGIETGSLVVLYASSPVCELVATARVGAIHTAGTRAVWAEFGHEVGIRRAEYDEYFLGAPQAVAIRLTNVERLQASHHLSELRARVEAFRPPQSFRYLSPRQLAALLPGNFRATASPPLAR
jgi:predicted transcriptional regulator